MDSSSDEILYDFRPLLVVYKDGRIERFFAVVLADAGIDPSTGVQSKDVVISPEINLSARLYIPKTTNPVQKLPVLIYFHGGGFFVGRAFSRVYHRFINLVVAEANVVLVSVDYRLAPEFHVPIAFDDSWAAIKWVASHVNGGGQEPWLNDYADLNRVFFSGDSAGGNISHNMAIRVGLEKLDGLKLAGIILIHPYFGGKVPIGAECDELSRSKAHTDKIWAFVSGTDADNPLFNPAKNPNLSELGCSKVLVLVAEKDSFRERGWYYQETMDKSGWEGKVEVMETKGEGHVFFLFNLTSDKTLALLKRMASFMNQIQSKA